MFTGGFFALGLMGPIAYLILGFIVIALLFSGAAVATSFRSNSGRKGVESQPRIDWAIGVLGISGLLSILGASFLINDVSTGTKLLALGLFLLWPVSAVLAIVGRGVGRKVLLVGHALIALWVGVAFLIMSIYVLRSRLTMH